MYNSNITPTAVQELNLAVLDYIADNPREHVEFEPIHQEILHNNNGHDTRVYLYGSEVDLETITITLMPHDEYDNRYELQIRIDCDPLIPGGSRNGLILAQNYDEFVELAAQYIQDTLDSLNFDAWNEYLKNIGA